MVTIRNKKTGETKRVSRSSLTQSGVAGADNTTHTSPTQAATGRRPGGGLLENLGLSRAIDAYGMARNTAGAGDDYLKYKMVEGVGNITNNPDPNLLKDIAESYGRRSKAIQDSQARFGFKTGPGNQFDPQKYATESLKGAAGLASWLTPAKAVQAISNPVVSKIAGAAITGAASSGLNELSQENSSPESIGKASAAGAVISGGLNLAGQGITALGKKIAPKAKGLIMQLFKPSQSDLDDLRKYGKMEFADEVVKRDLEHLSGKTMGKGYGDLNKYYGEKVDSLNKAADNYLDKIDSPASKRDVAKVMYDEMIERGRYKSGQPRVLQGEAKSKLIQLAKDYLGLTPEYYAKGNSTVTGLVPYEKDIDLVTLNQMKRDIQNAARSYYTSSGKPTPSSEALASVARGINNIIESNAPGTKDINKTITFYNMAANSIQKASDQSSKSGGVTSKILLGLGFTGAAGAVASGRLSYAVAAMAPYIGQEILRSPQFKTKAASMVSKAGTQAMPEIIKKLLIIEGSKPFAESARFKDKTQ